MDPAQRVTTEEDVKQLDMLSGLLVVLFLFFLMMHYSLPYIQQVEGAMVFSQTASTSSLY